MSDQRGHRSGSAGDGAPGTRAGAATAIAPTQPRAPEDGRSDGRSDGGLSSLLRRSLKSALARWVRQRAQGSRLRPQDEATHPWDGRRHHAEDYTFVAVQADLAAVIRVEWLPDRDTHRLWMILLFEDRVYATPGSGQLLLRGAGERGEGPWSVGGLTLDCVEPFRQWTIAYRGALSERSALGEPRPSARRPEEGPAAGARREASELGEVEGEGAGLEGAEALPESRVDLTFLASAPPFSPGSDDDPELLARHLGAAHWDADLLRGLRRRQMRGYVQVGEIHGSIALGDRILAISAAGLRQHAWGQRDWGASDRALQCFVARSSGQRVWVHRAHFPWLTLEGGFVAEDGAIAAVRELGVTVERRPDRAPSRVGLDLGTAAGEVAIDAATCSQISLEMDGRGRLHLAFIRLAGDAQGVGLWVGQERLLPRPRSTAR